MLKLIFTFYLAGLASPVWASDSLTILSNMTGHIVQNDSVIVREILPSQRSSLPPQFITLADELEQAGGRGRIIWLELTEKIKTQNPGIEMQYEGPYYIIDELPKRVPTNGKALYLKDPQLLAGLIALKEQKTGLILSTLDRGSNARIYGNDDLTRGLLPFVFREGDVHPLLGFDPSMSLDILEHEIEHIRQIEVGHPLAPIILDLSKNFDGKSIRGLIILLREIGAHRVQWDFIANHYAGSKVAYEFSTAYLTLEKPIAEFMNQRRLYIDRTLGHHAYNAGKAIKLAAEKPDSFCPAVNFIKEQLKALKLDIREDINWIYFSENASTCNK